jgi:hypothetical protein
MSRCSCTGSRHFRVTGEVNEAPADGDPHTVGTGSKSVRVRCGECGGKVKHIGSDLLNVLGIDDEEIYGGRCLAPNERVHLEVDLV